MPARAPHYISLTAAILAGFWAATRAPATHQFELTMRALWWTGQVLSPLSLLYNSAVTLVVMGVVMGVVYLGLTAILARFGFTSGEG